MLEASIKKYLPHTHAFLCDYHREFELPLEVHHELDVFGRTLNEIGKLQQRIFGSSESAHSTEQPQLANCHLHCAGRQCEVFVDWVCQEQCCLVPVAVSKRVR